MRLLSLTFKNVLQNWWRSLTLGSFILFASLIFVFFNSFVSTIKLDVEDSLVNALVGDIQVRPANVKQEDMAAMDADWSKKEYLKADEVKNVENILQADNDIDSYVKRVRQNVIFVTDTRKEPAMVIGLEPKYQAYQKSLKLVKGQYLDPNAENQVILSEKQAGKLKVKVGDKIKAMTLADGSQPIQTELTIVGIGNLQKLSGYGGDICYMDIDSARQLKGLNDGEVTDIIVYLSDRKAASANIEKISSQLGDSDSYKITSWKSQGGYIKTVNMIYIVMFYAFIAILLFIISILIINLVYMMGIERRQEIGTLRAIGFSKSNIVFIFMSEILLIAAIFCTIGVAISTGLVLFFSNRGIKAGPPWDMMLGDNFVMKFDVANIIPGLIIILGFAFIAALYPSLKAASLRPAETLKEK